MYEVTYRTDKIVVETVDADYVTCDASSVLFSKREYHTPQTVDGRAVFGIYSSSYTNTVFVLSKYAFISARKINN